MRKRVSLLILTITLLISGLNVQAAEKETSGTIGKYFSFFMNEIKGTKGDDSLSSLVDSAEDLLKNIKPEDAEKLMDFVEKQIQDGKWDSESGIKEAIAQGEKEFKTSLTEEQKAQILSIVSKIKELGISPEYVLAQAEKIYEKYGKELKEEAENAVTEAGKEVLEETRDKIKEEVNKSFTDYISDMVESVKSFFKGIFRN